MLERDFANRTLCHGANLQFLWAINSLDGEPDCHPLVRSTRTGTFTLPLTGWRQGICTCPRVHRRTSWARSRAGVVSVAALLPR